MKWRTFAHSGFWRWYSVSCGDETVADNGTRRVWLSVLAHRDQLAIEVAITPDETLQSLSAYSSMSWIREDSPASASAVVCISSLLRSLESDDPFVRKLSATLLSQVGLGRRQFADLDAADEVTHGVLADALLGRTEGMQVSLANGRLLRSFAGPAAVVIEWLAAPTQTTAPLFRTPRDALRQIRLAWSG